MTILPAAYLPSVEYFAHLLRGDCVIDLGEHFIKRSERNRSHILSPDGVMSLTVQVARANRPRTPMHAVKIDYSKRWQHQHWTALHSYYKASPYFDYYAPRFERFYTQEWTSLAEFNIELIRSLCDCVSIPMPPISTEYIVAKEGDIDLRAKDKKDSAFVAEPYIQVFADRMPFEANLSFIDLLFCEGPASRAVLTRCLQ